MTYLELTNAVLTRLRENTIDVGTLDSNPYYRSISAHINDAKRRVEDSWQWSALRGTEPFAINNDTGVIAVPSSADTGFILKRVFAYANDTGAETFSTPRAALRQISVDAMRGRYQDPSAAPTGLPREFAVDGQDATTGDLNLRLFPLPTNGSLVGDFWLEVDYSKNQADLVTATDRLLVPSLPVYTLATALASRERGEVGGAPTSELFGLADKALSDAIAQDSALYPDETVWYGGITSPSNTNIRGY